MAVHNPTSTTYANGVIEIISLVDFTYQEIVQSLANTSYKLYGLYIYAQNSSQLLQVLTFSAFDSNGNATNQDHVPTVDPNQYQNSIVIKFEQNNFIFTGRSFIGFVVEANEIIHFYLVTQRMGTADILPKVDFFDDFSNKISLE